MITTRRGRDERVAEPLDHGKLLIMSVTSNGEAMEDANVLYSISEKLNLALFGN